VGIRQPQVKGKIAIGTSYRCERERKNRGLSLMFTDVYLAEKFKNCPVTKFTDHGIE
jgi:hypothetical protein